MSIYDNNHSLGAEKTYLGSVELRVELITLLLELVDVLVRLSELVDVVVVSLALHFNHLRFALDLVHNRLTEGQNSR
jgi:hypothetical protein